MRHLSFKSPVQHILINHTDVHPNKPKPESIPSPTTTKTMSVKTPEKTSRGSSDEFQGGDLILQLQPIILVSGDSLCLHYEDRGGCCDYGRAASEHSELLDNARCVQCLTPYQLLLESHASYSWTTLTTDALFRRILMSSLTMKLFTTSRLIYN